MAAVWVVAWALSLAVLGIQLVAGVLPAGDEAGYFTHSTYFALDVALTVVTTVQLATFQQEGAPAANPLSLAGTATG